jgi:endonuclease/exonuclease/phosphatase family metal-dependent hydrolase
LAEQRIILGDFNARSSSGEISLMKVGYADAWAVGQSLDLDLAYEGNPSGNTRNGRIDYAFYSKQAAHLKLRKARLFDTRDGKGAMPSDHRPLLVTFDVK